MAEPKSCINHKYNLQIECMKFDIAIPMERAAVVEYLLYNHNRVDPNWLMGKVKAARTLNYERFYEDIPNNINLVNETFVVENPIHEKKSAGHYKEWKGKVLIELDTCKFSDTAALLDKIKYALENGQNYGRCRKVYCFNFLRDTSTYNSHLTSVNEVNRFPDKGVFVNYSKGVVDYYIDQFYQTYPFHKHDGISCDNFTNKNGCPIPHEEKEVEYKAALRGLKKVLALGYSPNAYTYGMYTRSTFEREYNLTWIPENKE